MCTATWIRAQDGYELFFNRDELRTRKPALAPRLRELGGARFLAPTDGDAGGTWLGVNEHGVTIGLANGVRTARDDGPATFRSRGLLVLGLLAAASVDEVRRRLEAADARVYRSFELFAIDAQALPRTWRSDGRAIVDLEGSSVAEEGTLLLSSSSDRARARAEREALLARMREEHGSLDADLLARFHASHEPERGAWSPCVHREEASTVSESRVRVGAREVAFGYRAGPPCEGGVLAWKELPRRGAASSRSTR
jgi:uncharacterized protein with NRDE domain